jgi:hypothetical protein
MMADQQVFNYLMVHGPLQYFNSHQVPIVAAVNQNSALQALTYMNYWMVKEQKPSMFAMALGIGITTTYELHKLTIKKGLTIEFKFLKPCNHWVQLNVCGYKFYD